MSVKEKEKKDFSIDEAKGDEHQIILYNDDFFKSISKSSFL